jgi:hypothetical protein
MEDRDEAQRSGRACDSSPRRCSTGLFCHGIAFHDTDKVDNCTMTEHFAAARAAIAKGEAPPSAASPQSRTTRSAISPLSTMCSASRKLAAVTGCLIQMVVTGDQQLDDPLWGEATGSSVDR